MPKGGLAGFSVKRGAFRTPGVNPKDIVRRHGNRPHHNGHHGAMHDQPVLQDRGFLGGPAFDRLRPLSER